MKAETMEYCIDLLFKEIKRSKKKARKERERLIQSQIKDIEDKGCEAAAIASENSLLMAELDALTEEFGSEAVEKVIGKVDYD